MHIMQHKGRSLLNSDKPGIEEQEKKSELEAYRVWDIEKGIMMQVLCDIVADLMT